MGNILNHPSAFPAAPAIMRVLAQFDRENIEGFIAVAIGLLDVMDGEPDDEETDAEDSFASHRADGVGCPVSDPDFGVDDDGEGIDEREADPAESGYCRPYGEDQSRDCGPDNLPVEH